MSHPYHHAASSARQFGGVPADYMPAHHWFDATKIAIADQRHRAFRHHVEAIQELENALRATEIVNQDGAKVSVRSIGLQHLAEDFGGYLPERREWVEQVTERPWMKLAGNQGLAAVDACTRRYGGTANDYAQLVEWFYEGTSGDPRSFYHRGHAMACFWAEEMFGVTFPLSTGKALPTRLAAELIVSSMFESRIIPAPQDWVRAIIRPTWQGKPQLLAA